MREKLSLLKLALGSPKTALKIAEGMYELRGALLAKLVEVLEPELKRPWHGWADKDFAHYVYSVLVEEKVARWREDGSLELVRRPKPPKILLPEVADYLPAVQKLVEQHLPDALEGRRKYFTDREQILLYARFLDNLGYNWFRKLALSLLLPKELRRKDQAVFADVGAGMGLSTLALLELTRGAVIAVDPYEENLENVRDYAQLKRAGHRVRVVRGYAEDFELEAPADAAVMINVLHWCNSPQLALRNAAANVKRGGFVAIVQGVRDAKGAWTGALPAYLLGAPRLPPTRSELYRMVKEEGLKVEKSYSLPAELVLAKVP
jgi:SAM-dependent methyltransferase